MPKNQNFRFSTGVRHPAPNYYSTKSLQNYRGLAVTRAVAVSFGEDSSLIDAVETGTNGASFDNSGKIEQENIFVGEAIEPCQNCGSTRINLVKMPDYSTHYAARRCAECDLFRGWDAKPSTKDKRQQQQSTISELLKSPLLSQWEWEFLQNLKGKKLSPKQQECLAKIEAKVEGES